VFPQARYANERKITQERRKVLRKHSWTSVLAGGKSKKKNSLMGELFGGLRMRSMKGKEKFPFSNYLVSKHHFFGKKRKLKGKKQKDLPRREDCVLLL